MVESLRPCRWPMSMVETLLPCRCSHACAVDETLSLRCGQRTLKLVGVEEGVRLVRWDLKEAAPAPSAAPSAGLKQAWGGLGSGCPQGVEEGSGAAAPRVCGALFLLPPPFLGPLDPVRPPAQLGGRE